MRNFYIDGTSSATYNIYASGENAYNAAERNVESISVPGRNGDLLIDNGTFKNIDVKYPCVIPYGFNANAIRSWLMSNAGGYHKITDDYDASHYRMGRYKGGIEFQPMYTNQAAALCDITFDCKPQRFLTSGETFLKYMTEVTETIVNPTAFIAKPIIRIYGAGSVSLNGATITVYDNDLYYIDVDCETHDCRGTDGENMNDRVEIVGNPVLNAGNNSFVIVETSRGVDVKPRWWEL